MNEPSPEEERLIAESQHKQRIVEVGCIVCWTSFNRFSPCQIHHMRLRQGMSQRADDWHVLGLCPMHHTEGNLGVAFHKGKKTFQLRFGYEADLLPLNIKRAYPLSASLPELMPDFLKALWYIQ